jgi:hypothetical protein
MLQIASGKFFGTQRYYETPHTGTFYTNYSMSEDDSIRTSVGNLVSSGTATSPATLAYEITEKIEWQEPAPGVMTSTGGAELIEDFAAVIGFALNVICTTDQETARRLTATRTSQLRRLNDPGNYLRRVFDAQIMGEPGDAALVSSFVTALIGLKRDSYERAIRAIRRYVTATHRIADDTHLAYALFVMSIEALAQAADAPGAVWSDYDESKRRRIDKAIGDAPTDLAERVRSAVLENEHVAMSRRFRDFAVQHLSPDFFRSEAARSIRPISRLDLVPLLRRAYDIRSGYVHRLQGLPKLLMGPFSHVETWDIDGHPTLTFEGLARLARHVITQFVQRSPKLERETFDWHSGLPNLLQMQLAPQYWIGRPEGYAALTATMWLQSFLTQVTATALRAPGAVLTDLTAILDKIETLQLDTVGPSPRRPMLTLYHLFIVVAGEKYSRAQHLGLLERYKTDFREPTVEELAINLVAGTEFRWNLSQLEALHDSYYRERRWKNSLMLGELLEAMFTLRLAEMNRMAANEIRARELITFAVEAFPGQHNIRALEQGLGLDKLAPINPRAILLPESG